MGDSESIGQRIRVLRQKLNYTQTQVEKATGIPQSNLSEFENGKLVPTIQTLFKIARFFGVSIAYLVGEGDLEGLKLNVRLLGELSEEGKKQIQDFIDFVVQRETEKEKGQ
ncbi:MAG: helix-turn-helix transcriptional regulator [Caldisericales bacterium]|nr:helix-turn-helix transcriptional regulator [Caldisericales bacterium]